MIDPQALLRIGFELLLPDANLQNPLRIYLVLPYRNDKGLWSLVPVMAAPLPEDPTELMELAKKIAGRRRKKKR
jgi:hypothetical protein